VCMTINNANISQLSAKPTFTRWLVSVCLESQNCLKTLDNVQLKLVS